MNELPQWLFTIVRVFSFAVGAMLIGAWMAMVLWTYQDIRSRSADVFTHVLATVLVLFLGLPGLLIHRIIRPRQTLAEKEAQALEVHTLKRLAERPTCPTCRKAIRSDWNVCPRCQTSLTTACQGCGNTIQRQWHACPYCGTEIARSRSGRILAPPLVEPRPDVPNMETVVLQTRHA